MTIKAALALAVVSIASVYVVAAATSADDAVAQQHWVVADVQLVRGTNESDTLDACTTQDGGWVPVGVNWADEKALYRPPLIAPFTPYFPVLDWMPMTVPSSFTFLCVLYKERQALKDDDRLVRDVAVYHRTSACPTGTKQLSSPNPNTVVCVEYDSAARALPQARYVVDLVTTTELYYNHENPEWRTHSVIAAQFARLLSEGDQQKTDPLELFTRCSQLDSASGTWERAGVGFVNDGDHRGLLCVQRLTGSDNNSTNGTVDQRVLVDVQVVEHPNATSVCPDESQEPVVNTTSFLLCGRWQRPDALNGEIVTDLALHRTQKPLEVAAEDMPGAWSLVSRRNLNDPSHASAAFLMVRKSTRRLQVEVLKDLKIPVGSASTNETSSTSLPLHAKLRNGSKYLSFRVLHISDLHVSGDPDVDCAAQPSFIRPAIRERAAQVMKESDVGDSKPALRSASHFSKCHEALSSAFMDELLDLEQPDLVVFGGDNVDVDHAEFRQQAMKTYSARVEAKEIPWAMVFGNHDTRGGFPLPEMMEIVENKTYSYSQRGPASVSGLGNYELNIQAPTDGPWGKNGSNVFRIYFLDSHEDADASKFPRLNEYDAYDWIRDNQIEFYRSLVKQHEQAGDKVPAIMFFHIPLPEYRLASSSTRFGSIREQVSSPRVNSGLFSTLAEMNDVKATFVGHDHVNDFCYNRRGIQLCYNGVSGFGTAYGRKYERRARVIEWTADQDNHRTIRSWQRHFADPATKHNEIELYTNIYDANAKMMAVATEHVVVDGAIDAALDALRRLLRTEDVADRMHAADLALERLRSHREDTSDDVNRLLRLLALHVPASTDMTEALVALLFFSDHRTLIIHHLPKLTYQGPACIQLVVDSLLDVLASDRALLVPILGALAEMPLETAHKHVVMHMALAMLDAVEETDVPAVTLSVLTMVTPATALDVLRRVREVCARVAVETLCLVLEVVGRFATAGSVVLKQLLRVQREDTELTRVDVLLLAMLMDHAAEHEVDTLAVIMESRDLLVSTAETLGHEAWRSLVPAFIRVCNLLLVVSLRDRTPGGVARELISNTMVCLGVLIRIRSVGLEEAMTLLLTLASQPQRLLLMVATGVREARRQTLCWELAVTAATQLAELATTHPAVLAPFAHLVLDHLHSIGANNQWLGNTSSQSHHALAVMEHLGQAMALLTKRERGIYSLVMITIQKQLVTLAGSSNLSSSLGGSTAVSSKQVMAVLLARHLLEHGCVPDNRDRKALINWIVRLLATRVSDSTLLEVLRLVRRGIRDDSSGFIRTSLSKEERAQLIRDVSSVFEKQALLWLAQDDPSAAGNVIAFHPTGSKNQGTAMALAVDVVTFVRKAHLGVMPLALTGDHAMQSREEWRKNAQEVVTAQMATKMELVAELFRCFAALASANVQDKIVDAALLLPPAANLEDNACDRDVGELAELAWSLLAGIHLIVARINLLVGQTASAVSADNVKLRKRLVRHLQLCLAAFDSFADVVQRLESCNPDDGAFDTSDSDDREQPEGNSQSELNAIWITAQCEVFREVIRQWKPLENVDLKAPLMYFASRWKHGTNSVTDFDSDTSLLQLLSKTVRRAALQSDKSGVDDTVAPTVSEGYDRQRTLELMLRSPEGKRTMKYIGSQLMSLRIPVGGVNDNEDGNSNEHQRDRIAHIKQAEDRLHILSDILLDLLQITACEVDEGDTVSRQKVIDLVVKGMASAVALRVGSGSNEPELEAAYVQELFFRGLTSIGFVSKRPSTVCRMIGLLGLASANSIKRRQASRLCCALLHHVFLPPMTHSAVDERWMQTLLQHLPNTMTMPRGGRLVCLSNYRPWPHKLGHVALLVISSWAMAVSAGARVQLLLYYLEAMRSLVTSMEVTSSAGSRRKAQQSAHSASSDDSDASEDTEVDLSDDERYGMAVNGEHPVLKTLTTASVPVFVETVLLCASGCVLAAAPARQAFENATSPFDELLRALDVLQQAMDLFTVAEAQGFRLPQRTNLFVLRLGSFSLKQIRLQLAKCIAWRNACADASVGALEHLAVLFDAVEGLLQVLRPLLSSFDDRVIVRTHQGLKKRPRDASTNDLLALAHKSELRRRRGISKSEAKLLPFLAHDVSELQGFVDLQRYEFECSVHEERDADFAYWTGKRTVWMRKKTRRVEKKPLQHLQPLYDLAEWTTPLKSGKADDGAADDEYIVAADDGSSTESDEDDDDGIDGFVVARNTRSDADQRQANEELGLSSVVVQFKKTKPGKGTSSSKRRR
ncbi:TPA: hypothetical protein N0F65_012194 [Lagenidium giganteum]|uniref:Calcineurin-like phosphoesterase domain-containing protein n=1 Tax=Lagenidium giganteum TaxID=4803 RepID=A0AAV2ZEG6_9STRA|nr:TPA: hypothetical protein N0F65_012194 [Lagenidium giganteum]